ncbi:MAG: hypothetical protein WCL28_06905 [bacterium]
MQAFFTSLFFAILALSCGRTEQKIELKNRLLEEVNDPNCKLRDCPELAIKLVDSSDVDITSKLFVGVQGSQIDWTIKVKSTAPAGRIKIALAESPVWIKRRESSSVGSLQLYGLPENVVTENIVKILARDISRCAALEKTTKECSNPKVSLADYDKIITFKYSIRAASP